MSNTLYTERILDHSKNPRNVGSIPNATHSNEYIGLHCGDKVKMDIIVKDGKIEEIKYEAEGCALTIASASLISEEFIGKEIDFVLNFTLDDLQELIEAEIPPFRLKCIHVGLIALQDGLRDTY